jgi:hypothetical protein
MLGYRSLFTVARDSLHGADVESLIASQIHAWLRGKKLDADAVQPGSVVAVGQGAEASLSYEQTPSGSRSSRFFLTEASGWTSQVVVHDPHDGRHDPWVWIDVNSPDDQTIAKAPRLAKMVLEVVEAHDGGVVLDPDVRTLHGDDVPALVAALTDGARRGPVFVAGSSRALPLEPWRALIGTLLRDTTGLAAGFLLDPEATVEFARLAGPSHAVAPGTLRTFLHDVAFDDDLDGRRHRILTTERIATDREAHLLRILGRVARDHTLTNPLPAYVARVEARLIRQADEDFLTSALITTTAKPVPSEAATAVPERQPVAARDELELQLPTSPESGQGILEIDGNPPPASAPTASRPSRAPVVTPSTRGPVSYQATLHEAISESKTETTTAADSTRSPEPVTRDGGLIARILAALRRIFGADGVTPEAIEELGERAAQVAPLRALVKRKEDAEQVLQDTIGNLRAQNATSSRQRDDVVLEWQEQVGRARRLDAELTALRRALAEAGHGELAWTDHLADDDVESLVPESFQDLLVAWSTARENGSLTAVIWTGDDAAVLDLDEHEPSAGWASVTWTILRALDDYARVSAAGTFNGSLDDYLRVTPSGCQGYSANRHAMTESESVRNNDKYATPRLLPVPETIDPSGRRHLWAHFKIANYATVAPRLHYLDATRTDGKIYVGYIGKHLPLPNVN